MQSTGVLLAAQALAACQPAALFHGFAASLLLEAADLLAPVLRTLWRRLSAAASWLLVQMVGRAVALVRRGVQQGSAMAAASAARAPASERGGTRQRQRDEQQQQQQREQRARHRQQHRGGRGTSDHTFIDGWAWQM